MAARGVEGKRDGTRAAVVKSPAVGHSRARMERQAEPTAPAHVRARPHPIYFAGTAGWVAFVAVATALVIHNNDLASSTDWAVVGWGVLAAAAGVVGPVVRWSRTSIDVDTATARCTTGILRRTLVEISLDQARELTVEQNFVGRRLGYGRLRVVDAAGIAHVLPPVGDVAALRNAVAQRSRRAGSRRG